MRIKDKIQTKFDFYAINSIGVEEQQSTEIMLTTAIIDLIDLEEELATLKAKLEKFDRDFPPSADAKFTALKSICINFEVYADDDSKITGNFPREFDIVQGINDTAKAQGVSFDARAMLSPIPTELGLFCLRVAARVDDRIVTGVVPVWFLPKEKHE